MANYARRRRFSRRRYSRGRRTLSTRNIFNNKGAKAQASQISALRKRVSYVYRQCRPEVKISENPVIQQYIAYNADNPYWLYSIDMPVEGVGDSAMTGNAINIKDVHMYLNAKVDTLTSDQQSPTYLLQGGVPITMEYRVMLFGMKSSVDTFPSIADFIEISTYSDDYSGYQMNAVRPLNTGASNIIKIFYDRRFSVSTQGQVSRSHKLKLKGSQIYKFTRNLYTGFSKGRLYALIIPVLHFESNLVTATGQTDVFTPAGLFNCITKFAYTDP